MTRRKKTKWKKKIQFEKKLKAKTTLIIKLEMKVKKMTKHIKMMVKMKKKTRWELKTRKTTEEITKTKKKTKQQKKTKTKVRMKTVKKKKSTTHSVGPEDESSSHSPDRPPLDSGLRLSRFSLSDSAETSTASPGHRFKSHVHVIDGRFVNVFDILSVLNKLVTTKRSQCWFFVFSSPDRVNSLFLQRVSSAGVLHTTGRITLYHLQLKLTNTNNCRAFFSHNKALRQKHN